MLNVASFARIATNSKYCPAFAPRPIGLCWLDWPVSLNAPLGTSACLDVVPGFCFHHDRGNHVYLQVLSGCFRMGES